MAGKIHAMIESILSQRGQGNPTLVNLTRTKLILKGINPDKFSAATEDDPAMMQKLVTIAGELGVTV